METHFPDITAPVGIDSFSKFDEHGTRAGKTFQVLLTTGMDTKRSIESWHSLGGPGARKASWWR